MKPVSPTFSFVYRFVIGGVGLALLILSTIRPAPIHWAAWIITVFIAFQVNFPLNVLVNEINMSQVMLDCSSAPRW